MTKSTKNLPNILVVIMDSVRARNTSLHGYDRKTTPFLNELSDDAVTHLEARAPGANTITSSASMFTGYPIKQHGLIHRGRRLEQGHTIWEELQAKKDYQTAVFSRNTNLVDLPIGLKSAFNDVFNGHDVRLPFPEALNPSDFNSDEGTNIKKFITYCLRNKPLRSFLNGLTVQLNNSKFASKVPRRWQTNKSDDLYTDLFLDWIDKQNSSWAVCINYMGAHLPYCPRSEHNLFAQGFPDKDDGSRWDFFTGQRSWETLSELENIYDGAIHQVDAEVRRLVQELHARGLYDDTLLIITSDHGEMFGEGSRIRDTRCVHHGLTGGLHEGILHVPLLIKWPGNEPTSDIEKIAPLTRLPSAIRTAVEGKEKSGTLTSQRFALSFLPGISQLEREEAQSHLDNLTPFEYPLSVAYEQRDGKIYKHFCCRNREIVLGRGRDNQTWKQQDQPVLVEQAFENIEKADITVGADTSISSSVKNQLEELGYV